jgi:hypothetical protein
MLIHKYYYIKIMKIKFLFTISVCVLLLTSCGLFTKKVDEFTENTKKDVEKKILKEFGVDDDKRKELIEKGIKAKGEITKVEDTRETLNNNPKVKLYVTVKPDEGDDFEAVVTMYVSRVRIPRQGDKVNVFYNPDNKKEIVVE